MERQTGTLRVLKKTGRDSNAHMRFYHIATSGELRQPSHSQTISTRYIHAEKSEITALLHFNAIAPTPRTEYPNTHYRIARVVPDDRRTFRTFELALTPDKVTAQKRLTTRGAGVRPKQSYAGHFCKKLKAECRENGRKTTSNGASSTG